MVIVKKVIMRIYTILLSVILLAGCSCGGDEYTNDYEGVYSYIVDNAVTEFYYNWGYYNSWVEYKGFLSTGDDYINVSLYAFTYTDQTKETLDYSYSIHIKFDGSRHADYQYFFNSHSTGFTQYSNGIFTVGDYNGYTSSVKLTPSETNMKSQPEDSVSLLTTILRNYMHSKGFTLDALGYSQYK